MEASIETLLMPHYGIPALETWSMKLRMLILNYTDQVSGAGPTVYGCKRCQQCQ